MNIIKTFNTTTKRYENNSKAPTSHELFQDIQILEETIKVATSQLLHLKQKISALILYS